VTAPQTIAAIRAYSPTLIAADAERIHVGTAEGCSISIHADNLADMLRTWADAVDEATGRPPCAAFPLDVIAWLASPPQHYPPDELCRRIVSRLEQAGVTGDLLNRMREHVGGAK